LRKKTLCLYLIPLLITSITLVSLLPAHVQNLSVISSNPPEIVDEEINHLTLDDNITVASQIGDCHTDHLNDPTDDFPNDYAPMVIPFNGKNVTIAPVIRDTCLVDDVFKPNYYPCKSAQTFFVDDNWSDKDANYTYLFEDWTDYDWNDINVSLYAVTNEVITVEIHLVDREAAWKNPFSVEITPEGLTVNVYWNSTDYPEHHVVGVNPDETVAVELFAESNPGDTASIMIVPQIPPVASFVYSPLHPQVSEDVTFNASASTPDGGYIVSYTWNFGDSNITTVTDPIVTHRYGSPGNYTVTLNVTDSEGEWDMASKNITVTPRTYTLKITTTPGGETDPDPGTYHCIEGTVVNVTAIPYPGYKFDYWELDGVKEIVNPISVVMAKDYTLHAVFSEVPVGGHAMPIDKPHFLDPEIELIPVTGLTFAPLAVITATIMLIRRRNKKLKRER